jgi:TPR repeat protein
MYGMKEVQKTQEEAHEVLHLLEQAARQDEPEANFLLGLIYTNGEVGNFKIAIDEEKALRHFKKSAEHEYCEAFAAIGIHYYNQNDMTNALYYLEKASELDGTNEEVKGTLLSVYRALEMTEKAKALKAKMKK